MRYLTVLILIGACATTQKSPYPIYLHEQIPTELCKGGVEKLGIYRKLNDNKDEWLPYCSPEIKHFISVDVNDLIGGVK